MNQNIIEMQISKVEKCIFIPVSLLAQGGGSYILTVEALGGGCND